MPTRLSLPIFNPGHPHWMRIWQSPRTKTAAVAHLISREAIAVPDVRPGTAVAVAMIVAWVVMVSMEAVNQHGKSSPEMEEHTGNTQPTAGGTRSTSPWIGARAI